MTEYYAVDHIADRTTENQGECDGGGFFVFLQFFDPEKQHDADDDRNQHKKPALPAAGVRQKAEGSALVIGQKPFNIRHHADRLMVFKLGIGDPLCSLIGNDDDQADP